jgi:hypothetical protein
MKGKLAFLSAIASIVLGSCSFYSYKDVTAYSACELRITRLSLTDGSTIGTEETIGRMDASPGEYLSAVHCTSSAMGEDGAIARFAAERYVAASALGSDNGRRVYEGGTSRVDLVCIRGAAASLCARPSGAEFALFGGSYPLLVAEGGAYRLNDAAELETVVGWKGDWEGWRYRKASTWAGGLLGVDTAGWKSFLSMYDGLGSPASIIELPFRADNAVYEPGLDVGTILVGAHSIWLDPKTGENSDMYSLAKADSLVGKAESLWSFIVPDALEGDIAGVLPEGLLFIGPAGARIVGDKGAVVAESSFVGAEAFPCVFPGQVAGSGFAIAPGSIVSDANGLSAGGGSLHFLDSSLDGWRAEIPSCQGYLAAVAITGSYVALVVVRPQGATTITIREDQGF